MTAIDRVPFGGWPHNLRIANEAIEAVVTLDVGPRVISLRRLPRGANVFFNDPEQLGRTGEPTWRARGGHRLWIAPEDRDRTYVPDNGPVEVAIEGNACVLINPPAPPFFIEKRLTIAIVEAAEPRVDLIHRAVNAGTSDVVLATWGLTQMAPGGTELIPEPPLGEFPRDLLPSRAIVVWPYTDLADPRLAFGRSFIRLAHSPRQGPIKLGCAGSARAAYYFNRGDLFVKRFDVERGATYPDLGASFETYADQRMVELETLSPLATLAPGASVGHRERWHLLDAGGGPRSLSEEDVAGWLATPLAGIAATPM